MPHLYERLMEIGPVKATAAGQEPIGWETIKAWSEMTFTRISAWEGRLLRRLSTEYLAELHLAEDRTRPAPWMPERPSQAQRDAELRQLQSVLG